MKLLIEKRVDVNERVGNPCWRDIPLMSAASDRHLEVAKLLLEIGAQVNEKDCPGNTALIVADRADIVSVLFDNNADTNAAHSYEKTAPMAAACAGNAQKVKQLLDNGTDITAGSKHGWTALKRAAAFDFHGANL